MIPKIATLVNKLKKYNAAYRKGKPIVSDSEYDLNIELLKSLDPNNLFLIEVEPERFKDKRKIFHNLYMLSMEKAYDLSTLKKFVIRVNKDAQSIGVTNFNFKVSPKLDGLAARDDGRILVSRGNGHIGYDISNAFLKGIIPIGGRGNGLGEIVVVKSFFEKYLKNFFEHPRNMVAGIISSDTINKNAKIALDAGQIHFVPYTLLKSITLSGDNLINQYKNLYKRVLENIEYPVDGIVAEVNNNNLRNFMGFTSNHYRWQIALKRRGETADTCVTKINWQIGRSGKITPVIEVDPVYISGSNIKRVSAHNAGFIRTFKIGVGSRIKIIRSGEVIPKLESVIKSSNLFYLPEICPICNVKLKWDKDFLVCTNLSCYARKEQRIFHWFNTLGNTEWFGAKTIQKIVRAGYSSLESIYNLKFNDFKQINFGEKQSINLHNSLLQSKINPVEDWRFLAAFGIPGLGLGFSLKLLNKASIKDIPYLNKKLILSIHGIGKKKGELIKTGIDRSKNTILKMLSLKFNLITTKIKKNPTNINFLNEKNIVFTGKMDAGSRIKIKNQAMAYGIKVQSKINQNTDYLVLGANGSKLKLDFAKKTCISILNEKDYFNMLKRIKN